MNLKTLWASNGHNTASDKLADVRNVLGREAEHLAQVAAQMGRDAGTHADAVARDVGRDAQKQTNATVGRFADIAAAFGPTIAAMGRQRMRQVGEQAQTLGHELRQVRITTEPQRSDSKPGIALVGGLGIGLGIGIAAMYLFDPEHGKRRRELLMGRLARWTSNGRTVAAQKVGEFTDRTLGVMSDVRESVTTGVGIDQPIPTDMPIVAEDTVYETWPEGTRVPTV